MQAVGLLTKQGTTEVEVTSLAPLPAAGQCAVVTSTPTVTAAAYASGNSVGGKIALASIMSVAGGSAFLHHVSIVDKSNTKPSGNLIFFDADPTAATLTDKSAFVYSTDISKQIGRVAVSASDYASINSIATASLPNLGRLMKSAATTGLWMAFVLDGTSVPTFASTSDIIIKTKWIPNSN